MLNHAFAKTEKNNLGVSDYDLIKTTYIIGLKSIWKFEVSKGKINESIFALQFKVFPKRQKRGKMNSKTYEFPIKFFGIPIFGHGSQVEFRSLD